MTIKFVDLVSTTKMVVKEYDDSTSVNQASVIGSLASKPRTRSGAQHEAHEARIDSKFQYTKRIAFGLVIIGLVYFLLYLVLAHDARLKDTQATDETLGANLLQNVATCGADSFMLRDSVCDEATNTEECRYDGGDCCLEIKDTSMCRNCSCILLVDPDRLQGQFYELTIKPVRISVDSDPETDSSFDWTVYVQDVVSGLVCSVLCIDHNGGNSINAWRYNNSTLVCQCGWLTSRLCPETYVKENWELRKVSNLIKFNTYVQLGKIISCGCQASGLLVNGARTIANQRDLEVVDFISATLWHCQHECQLDRECVLFSWKWHEQSFGECRHFTGATEIIVDYAWISSAETCDDFSKYFILEQTTYRHGQVDGYIENQTEPQVDGGSVGCIQNQPVVYNHNMEDSLLIVTTGVDPINESKALKDTQLFAIAENSAGTLQLSEVVHSGLNLPLTWKKARGGLLKVGHYQEDQEPPQTTLYDAIICGGERKSPSESGSFNMTDECFRLVDPLMPIAKYSVVRDRPTMIVLGKGAALWVAGGSEDSKATDMITSVNANQVSVNSDHSFPSSHLFDLRQNCIQMLKNTAILYGGLVDKNWLLYSWYFDLDNDNPFGWRMLAEMNYQRIGQMCGLIRSGSYNKDHQGFLVSAGGQNNGIFMDSVELFQHSLNSPIDGTSKNSWEIGPAMPKKLTFGATATSHDQRHMFVAGGKSELSWSSHSPIDNQASIISLTCLTPSLCKWTWHSEVSLSSGRTRSLAFILPPNAKLSGVCYIATHENYTSTEDDLQL